MNNRTLRLADHDLVELADARGQTLQMTRGTAWVTQHGDSSDVMLTTGDTWTIEGFGSTVVEARGNVEVTLIGNRPVAAKFRNRRSRWQDRLARWIRRAADGHLRRRWVPHL